jgi:hypothetical protein
MEQLLAVGHINSVLRDACSIQRAGLGDAPENGKTQHCEQCQAANLAFGKKTRDHLFFRTTELFVATLAGFTKAAKGCLE